MQHRSCVCGRGRGTGELKELLSKQATVLGDSATHRLEPARASALSACVPCETFSSRPRGETDTNSTRSGLASGTTQDTSKEV